MLNGMRIAQEDRLPIVVSGSIGPRRDGCTEADEMHPREAAQYHKPQIEAFADADADLITATNMTNMNEAAAYYMIDCTQMSRLDTILARGGVLRGRFRGLRAIGPARTGQYKDILNRYPSINILDGDGGVNRRQREELSEAGQAAFRSAA